MLTNPFTAVVREVTYLRTSPMGHAVYKVVTDWGTYNTRSNAGFTQALLGNHMYERLAGKTCRITLSGRGTITDMEVVES